MLRWTHLLGVLVALATAPALAAPETVTTHTLANGMKLLINEEHAIPNVALYIFYRVGSRNERPGTTGLTHFFEHMMFNGAKKYGPHQFDRVMEAAGGSNNAYTTSDVTVFEDWFPTHALALVLDLEADRMKSLTLNPKLLGSERRVVANERRNSVEANDLGMLTEQVWAAAFTAHPYGWPVIGWQADIENWTIDDLKQHYAMGFSPSNAVMVVCGDVKPAEIILQAKRMLESVPARPVPPQVSTAEPPQMGERRIVVRKLAQAPTLMIAYHVPAAQHPDYYPLKVLQTVLFQGESSRMVQVLVDQYELSLWVTGEYDLTLDPTLFVITSQPKTDTPVESVEQAIYREITRLSRDLISEAELQKAKNILLTRFYRRVRSISRRAEMLGAYEIFFGDHRRLWAADDAYNAVTREDVRRVVRAYFSDKNRTVGILAPESTETAK